MLPRSINSSSKVFLKDKDDSTCRYLTPGPSMCAEEDLEAAHWVVTGEAAKPS